MTDPLAEIKKRVDALAKKKRKGKATAADHTEMARLAWSLFHEWFGLYGAGLDKDAADALRHVVLTVVAASVRAWEAQKHGKRPN